MIQPSGSHGVRETQRWNDEPPDRTEFIRLRLPIHTVSEANRADHEHWTVRQRRAKSQRADVKRLVPPLAHIRPGIPCRVHLTRIAPRKLDEGDNGAMWAKHIRDELAVWIGVNDRDPRVAWCYGQRQEAPRTYGVEIEITWTPKEAK